jgi:hypothetical protein
MKLDKAIEDVQHAEAEPATELRVVGERHAVEHDLYRPRPHAGEAVRRPPRTTSPVRRALRRFVRRRPRARIPGLLETLRHKSAELLGRSERSGLLLLRDLRNLYVTAQEAELAWLILAQAAQAVRDRDLLQTVTLCHEEAEARGEWLRTRIKESPRFSPPASARRSSLQPGGEGFLDIGAAARSFESRPNPFRLDDDDRWRLLNAEARGEIVVCFVVDSAKGEGVSWFRRRCRT